MPSKPKIQKPQVRLHDPSTEIQFERCPDGSIYWTHTPPPPEQAKNFKWRPIWCAGYETDEQGKRHYHHIDCIPCHCPPGPQYRAINSSAFEVALIGGRGSAKSEATFGFLVKGNPVRQTGGPSDTTYLNNPNFSFLVLRKNAKDLKSYKKRAGRFFTLLGGTMTEEGVEFPSGAWGIFDHLADGDAWEKYQGQEFVRLVIEEANQIPDFDSYLKVMMSCRTSDTEMFPQIMLTLNPGGKGQRWTAERFYKVVKADGKKLKSGEIYRDAAIKDEHRQKRVFIKSTVDDNPYQLAAGYDAQLDILKEARPGLWKQWRHGDMDAMDDQFFAEFRPKLLVDQAGNPTEAPNAVHVIAPKPLSPYWPRAIGCDWGYSHKSAVGWGCWTPSKQLHVYRELVVSKVGAVELGVRIAEKSFDDLKGMPNHHLTMYLSPDAFSREHEGGSEAELIAQGINTVLGKNAAFVMSTTEEEELLEDKAAWSSVYRRQRQWLDQTNITIVPAPNKRKPGWNLLHEYMRWWQIATDGQQFNDDVARQILETEGARAWWEYKQNCQKKADEVLPILQIWNTCPALIEGIQAAQTKEADTEDIVKEHDDEVDMLRYLAMGFSYQEAVAPKEIQVAEHVRVLRETMPGLSTASLIMAARQAEQSNKGSFAAVNLPRFAARRQRISAQMQQGRLN